MLYLFLQLTLILIIGAAKMNTVYYKDGKFYQKVIMPAMGPVRYENEITDLDFPAS